MSVATLSHENSAPKTRTRANARSVRAETLEAIGRHMIRYGLVAVLLWIGAMKFTAYEADGISGLVSNSPLTSWVYQFASTRQFGVVLGVAELFIAGLIATRPVSAKVSAVGSVLATAMFATTLSFLLTTPGVIESSLGFPALSVMPGQFLIKDVVLLGAALWATGEALTAAKREATRSPA